MKRVLCLFLITAGCAPFSAAAPSREIFNYLRPILEREMTGAQDVWEKSGHGGYVMRFDLDMTGDGMPEMFLGTTLWSWKSNITWDVYRRLSQGEYEPYIYSSEVTGVSIRASEILLEEVGNQKSIITFGADHGKYYVGRYNFRDTSIVFERSEVSEAKFAELKAGPNIKRVAPNIRGVLLADLLRNPNAEWRPIDFKSGAPNPEGYYIAPEDAERVKGLVNFTPDLALKWLESATVGKKPVGDLPKTPKLSPQSATGAQSILAAAKPGSAVMQIPAPTDRRIPILLWLGGIAALAVMALLFLKWRA